MVLINQYSPVPNNRDARGLNKRGNGGGEGGPTDNLNINKRGGIKGGDLLSKVATHYH